MSRRRRLLPTYVKHETPNTSLAIVNIVFLLLFYFLVTGSQAQGPDFDIHIARVKDQPLGEVPKPVLLIGADGDIRLDGVLVALDDLSQAVADLPSLDIVIDKEARADQLLDLIATPGFEALDMHLVTENLISQE